MFHFLIDTCAKAKNFVNRSKKVNVEKNDCRQTQTFLASDDEIDFIDLSENTTVDDRKRNMKKITSDKHLPKKRKCALPTNTVQQQITSASRRNSEIFLDSIKIFEGSHEPIKEIIEGDEELLFQGQVNTITPESLCNTLNIALNEHNVNGISSADSSNDSNRKCRNCEVLVKLNLELQRQVYSLQCVKQKKIFQSSKNIRQTSPKQHCINNETIQQSHDDPDSLLFGTERYIHKDEAFSGDQLYRIDKAKHKTLFKFYIF